MRIRLISHASVIIEAGNVAIWTDPWLFGKVHNDSWSLFPKSALEEPWLENVAYLWISCALPDYFHLPSLQSLPPAFKKRVTILMPSHLLEKAALQLEKMGFEKTRGLEHKQIVSLDGGVEVCAFDLGPGDAAIGVRYGCKVVWDIHHLPLSNADISWMRREFGSPDVLLQQFSLTNYPGFAKFDEHLPKLQKAVLRSMEATHEAFDAKLSVPFAGFFYFSSDENRFMNAFTSSMENVHGYFDQRGLKCGALYPGEVLDMDQEHDPTLSLIRFAKAKRALSLQKYDAVKSVPVENVKAAFLKMHNRMRESSPWFLSLAFAIKLRVWMPDQSTAIEFDLRSGSIKDSANADAADAVINSQALCHALENPLGIKSLEASAKLRISPHGFRWNAFKIAVSILDPQEDGIAPLSLFDIRNVGKVADWVINQIKARTA